MEGLDAASTSPLAAMADPGSSSSSLDVIFDAQKDPDPASLEAAMQFPITVMLGAVGPLLRKLRSLVASERLSALEIRLLKALCISMGGMSEDEGASFMARWWMKIVRELCYDTDDRLEEVIDGSSAHHDFSALLARAKDVREKRNCFQWSPPKIIKPAEPVEAGVSHLTSIELPVPLVFRLELPRKLVELLALDDYEKKLKVIPIHGCAGVGKTTAARTLYYKHGGKFQYRAFITASRNPYMRGLLTSMLSQLKAPRPHGFTDVPDLIAAINKHLQGKRYFIVIDDLWTASVWNIISRAFPHGDSCSRIITTTQIDDVALECCGYYPVYMYKMEPLNDYVESRHLFFGTVFGSEDACPTDIKEVSYEIIRKCGGLPLAIVSIASLLASESNITREKWKHIQECLPSTSKEMKDVQNLMYNSLPHLMYNSLPPRLRTCLLYLSMYQQGDVIKKDDLVKHWVAEGFLSAARGGDIEQIAEDYFDELVSRGMVQAVDISNNGKVLSCSVHQIVLDFIRHKSREENFVITVDYNQSTLDLPDKVRRLSVQFGGVKSAYIPESIVTSHVRSLIFWGFFKCAPSSFMDYGLLRILTLHIWADKDNESFDLTGIEELFLLKYLKIECNITVKLPGKIRRLQHLGTLQVDARLSAVPSDIVRLENLLHLHLPSEYILPNVVAHMTSLRTLGYFDLSSHSEENVLHLGRLSNLQDLQLTCSTVQPTENLERNVQLLGSIIEKLGNLQSVTLVPASASSNVNIPQDDAHATSISIPVDGFSMVSPPLGLLLRKIELSRRCCVFFSLPKWFGELRKLCILKIGIRRLSMDDTDILKGLPALAALTLYIETAPAEKIVIDKGGFKVLTYFKFMCSAPCLSFVQGAMPKLQKLKQGFNSNKWKPNTFWLAGFRNLIGLTELFVKIGVQRAEEFDINVAESVLESAFWNPPSTPTIRVQYVDVIFCAKEDKRNVTEELQQKRQKIEKDKENKHDESRHPAQAGAMTDIDAMIAASLLKEVVQQIGSLVGGQITLQQNFDKDLNEMKTTLESIEALLKDAEHANTNNSMRLWLNRLKNTMYGIADMIDDFEAGTEAEPTRKFSINELCKMGPKFTLANKMKTMREELQGITDQYQKFTLVSGSNADELKIIQMRETSSTSDASIIGRTEEENKILVSLSESVIEELIVLAIHGIGGLGKTTLAKMIYNNKTKFEDYVRVWIYVSETFDLNKIGNSLISQLSENESTYAEKQMIHRSLAKLFANKKILIILDDLWAEDDSQLDSLIDMLKVGKGSKVVVIATTRNEEIARKISTIPSHELASLTDEMCWTIIKQKSGFESRDDKEQFKDIGEAIAAKCGGVALAAQSIGPILETMNYHQWKNVRDSDIWKVSASSSDPKDKAATRVLASLRLSYTFMPRYLKLCFAYWAIFPKGCKISKCDLIHQWISLSFIGATPTFTAWELGEMYITQLLKLSFLEHSKIARLYHSDVTAFTMHDLLHDLARSVMDDEILLAGNDGNIGGNRCHYALLNDCSKLLESRRIRALRLMRSAKNRLDDAAFASAKSLRVLDLSECPINKLTDSIGRLKQLRYLNAPRVRNEVIPDSITRLSKLLYLSLRESSLSALPESVGEMEGLMYLDLSRCRRIKELPESFGKLRKLVHLDLSECSALENISKFMWSFTDLQYLNLSRCYCIGSLPESLDGLNSLQYLNLHGCLREGENDSLMDSISGLSNLEHLDLSCNDGITSLPESFCNLRKLHTLDLSYCQEIQKIPESIGRIDSLKTLYLLGCHSLVEKPAPHPSTSFVSLPLFEVRAGDGESSSNLVYLKDTNPRKLYIVGLENVMSAEEAQSIKLMEKNNLKILCLSWTEGAERFVDDKVLLEKLVPPKSLTVLKIIGYNGVSLPTWVGQRNWVTLTRMEHLEELSVSDSSGMLCINNCPKLRMGPLLPRAVGWLEIRGGDNVLSSWGECTMSSTGASSSSSSSVLTTRINYLTVGYSELPMQQWRLLRHLSGLDYLKIESCPDLTVSPDIIPHLSSVRTLTINECNISSLPHWLMDLTGLQVLQIYGCEGIRYLPEGIQQLTKLQTLRIGACPDLKKWCESEENKMKLAHIKNKDFR